MREFRPYIGKGDDPLFCELMRLLSGCMADHENANVSAHSVSLVGSALWLSTVSCLRMNGLAGRCMGRPNQVCCKWLLDYIIFIRVFLQRTGDEYARKSITHGKFHPGYGHAVLRCTDPSFIAERISRKQISRF